MKTLLITGGAGFIGSHFVELAVSQGYRAIVLDALTYAGNKENLAGIACELVIGNICDRALVDELLERHKPSAILNFAAETHVDNSIAGPGAFIKTNIDGTYQLLEAARAYAKDNKDFRYVQISTDEVYGTLGTQGYFREDTPLAPNSPYSASKASADMLVRAWYETYGLATIITRCSNNYGPRQHAEKLIPRIISQALASKDLPVYGTGKNVRDWIHVTDHCLGILAALERGEPGSVYCFGGHAEKTNLDVVHLICDLLDQHHPRQDKKSYREQIRFVTDRLGHDFRYAIDDSKTRKSLGVLLAHASFEQGLKSLIQAL